MAGYAQTKRAEATGQLAIYLECRRDATQAAFTVRHRWASFVAAHLPSGLSGRLYDRCDKPFPLSRQSNEVKLFQWDQLTVC